MTSDLSWGEDRAETYPGIECAQSSMPLDHSPASVPLTRHQRPQYAASPLELGTVVCPPCPAAEQ